MGVCSHQTTSCASSIAARPTPTAPKSRAAARPARGSREAHEQAWQGEEAEDGEDGGVGQVDAAFQEVDDVGVHGEDERADEEHNPAPEDEEVHDARVEVVRQATLADAVDEEDLRALPGAVPALLRPAEAPAARPAGGAAGGGGGG